METNWNQLIERFLQNELSEEGRIAFEQELKDNTALQNELETHKLITESAKRSSQRLDIQRIGKWYNIKRLTIQSAIVVAILAGITAVIYLSTTSNFNDEKEQDGISSELKEQLKSQLQFDNVKAEYFAWNGSDSVILSKSGVLLSIPQHAFMLDGKAYNGKAVIQWQEARDASDIVKAGLSTTSGNRLLETQGMFAIQAVTPEGKELAINEKTGVYVQVPVDEIKEGMQLFEGKKDKQGNTDWINPQPLEKLPLQADMKELNFYPPQYETKLDELRWKKEKEKRDSLYLSFEEVDEEEDFVVVYPIEETIDERFFSYFEKRRKELIVQNESGEDLFYQLCVGCHQPHSDGTGPKLFKVREKWAKGGAKEGSIYQWVSDWKKASISDPYAMQVAKMTPVESMSFPELVGKTKEIDAIFDWIDSQTDDFKPREINKKKVNSHIPPSKVLAIWNPKFNATILATRDFEKRMKSIHKTCSEKVFNVYANQLNKPLWELDKQVAKMGYPEFNEFAKERVGAIQLSNPHTNNLRHFYESAISKLREKDKKAINKAKKVTMAWDSEMRKARTKETTRSQQRETKALSEEYDLNLKNVYKQLGYAVGFKITHGGGTVYNIDKYVMDATVARESTVITDPTTGKKATITYNDFSAKIENGKQYGKLYLYLFPKEINSFQRIDAKNGVFDYPLNNDISYDMAFIGINEDGYYILEKRKVNKGNLGSLSLEKVSENEFNNRIEALNKQRNDSKKRTKINDELEWLFKEQKDYEVQTQRRKQEAFRRELEPIVYPCKKNTEADSLYTPEEISF